MRMRVAGLPLRPGVNWGMHAPIRPLETMNRGELRDFWLERTLCLVQPLRQGTDLLSKTA